MSTPMPPSTDALLHLSAPARIGVGVFYLATSAFLLPLQAILALLFLHGQKSCASADRTLAHLCIAFFLQTFGHAVGGLWIVLPVRIPFVVVKTVGSVMNSASISSTTLLFLLALSRLILFYPNSFLHRHFDCVSNGLLVVSWMIGALFTATLLTPWTDVIFDAESLCWGYDDSLPWTQTVANFDAAIMLASLTATFLVYIALFATLVTMRGGLTSSKVPRRDFLLLVQSVILYLYFATLVSCWHYHEHFLPDSPWTAVGINAFWVGYCSLTPVLSLLTHSVVRRRFCQIVLRHKSAQFSSVLFAKTRSVSVVPIASARTRLSIKC